MANSQQAKILQHVVAIPYPAQGHINPMLQLCQQLVPHGFTFTFVNTSHIHQRVHSANPTDNRSDGHTHYPHQDAHVHDLQHGNGHAHTNIHTHHHVDKGKDDDSFNQHLDEEAHANTALHNHEGQTVQILSHSKPIRMVFVEGGCPPEKHAHISTAKEAFDAAQDMKEQVEQLLSDIMEEEPVAFILTDILLGWANATASKFGLPWVCFWAASAATCAAFFHFADLAREGKHIPMIAEKQDGHVTVINDIPGLPPTLLHDLPRAWDDAGKVQHVALDYFNKADEASYLLLNTFAELEEQVLQALSKRCPTLAVGPLVPSGYMSKDVHTCPDIRTRKVERPSLFREDRTCLDWLDKQAPSSVLYISFGSISARTEEQLEELAHGVDASGCPFLWVHRPDISKGFIPGTGLGAQRGNGLVVPWAPQLDVLSHPSVGGFLTHCGWNSIMESVAMGVPMLCWADTGERLCNQRFTVQFWKCGLDMLSDSRRHTQNIDEAVLVRREEIEKSIRCLMLQEAGVGASIRAKAAHLRDAAILAFHDSSSHFSRLVHAM